MSRLLSCFSLLFVLPVMALAAPSHEIVGGSDALADEPVTQSTVLIYGKLLRSHFTCTGVIIGKDAVLTAGHCLGGQGNADLTVLFGVDQNRPTHSIAVRDQVRPDNYNTTDHDHPWNDIAILRLAQNIPASYQPAQLLADANAIQDGASVLLAGYGINVPISNDTQNEGAGRLRKVEQKIIVAKRPLSPTEMLIDIKGHGSCFGDSGGPAYFQTKNGLIVAGIVSHMTEKDRLPDDHGHAKYGCIVDMAYTRVPDFMAWIQAALNAH